MKKKNTRKQATEVRGKKINRAAQPTIKIDGGLNIELDAWIQTEGAASLGFHSKSDFATEAIRKFMQSVRGPRFTDLRENDNGDYILVDTYLDLPSKYLTILVDKKHLELRCEYCKESKCDHVFYLWKSLTSSARLNNLGFKCEFRGDIFKLPI